MTEGKHGTVPTPAEVAPKATSPASDAKAAPPSGKIPTSKPAVAEKATVVAEEATPEVETPETPKVPEEAPRDLTTIVAFETPEAPVIPTAAKSVPHVKVVAVVVPDLHVSTSPVDSHAPVWLGREPNSP